jgi:hypothetical protein
MKLNEEYSEVYKILEDQKISTPKAEGVILRLLYKIIKEIEADKRNKMDIGDPGWIGLKFNDKYKRWHIEIKNFFYYLTGYEGDQHPNLWGGDIWDGKSENVKKDLIELAKKYGIPLL